MDRKARARFFNESACRQFGKESAGVWLNNLKASALLASADIVPAFFHRSCGKACGKAALRSYKFLKILYF
jgi:hypothetical protein